MQVLFRSNQDSEDEYEVCCQYFDTIRFRTMARPTTIIGRYSVLPFYDELAKDLATRGANLINSVAQHNYVASFSYYAAISALTPKTYWDGTTDWMKAPDRPYVVKGATNSRKGLWNTLMFAKNKRQAIHIGCELAGDDLIGSQGIIYREFVPLKVFETGINEIPFSNEWRCFFYKDRLLSYGYYWSSASTETVEKARMTPAGLDVACKAAKLLAPHVNLFAIDVAETASGSWIVIEVNDGQMAGLSENNPHKFYQALAMNLK